MPPSSMEGASTSCARSTPTPSLGLVILLREASIARSLSGRGAFLDCRKLGAELAKNFPTVFAACRSAGIDPTQEPIPIAPAAHYHMGGVLTDANGRTTVDGLWACGEVASTGAHGANRLASNSLLEAVVFGARIAADIAGAYRWRKARRDRSRSRPSVPPDSEQSARAVQQLRRTMTAEVGVIRNGSSLADAPAVIASLETSAARDRRLLNMLTTAKLITAAALARKESRGAHFRSDYPQADARLASRSFFTLAQAHAIAAEAAGSGRIEPVRVAALHG